MQLTKVLYIQFAKSQHDVLLGNSYPFVTEDSNLCSQLKSPKSIAPLT